MINIFLHIYNTYNMYIRCTNVTQPAQSLNHVHIFSIETFSRCFRLKDAWGLPQLNDKYLELNLNVFFYKNMLRLLLVIQSDKNLNVTLKWFSVCYEKLYSLRIYIIMYHVECFC